MGSRSKTERLDTELSFRVAVSEQGLALRHTLPLQTMTVCRGTYTQTALCHWPSEYCNLSGTIGLDFQKLSWLMLPSQPTGIKPVYRRSSHHQRPMNQSRWKDIDANMIAKLSYDRYWDILEWSVLLPRGRPVSHRACPNTTTTSDISTASHNSYTFSICTELFSYRLGSQYL